MKINFVGNYQTGYVGEVSDETHLARELEGLGHEVNKIPRDVWKAHCDGETHKDWLKWLNNMEADVNILAKWHHFREDKYVYYLRNRSDAPVIYWTWDWMEWPNPPHGHDLIAKSADLHLTNEGGDLRTMIDAGVNARYFPFDVVDGTYPPVKSNNKLYDVVFFGSCIPQGVRKDWLKIIAKNCDLTIFSWNYQEWQKMGMTANKALYGNDFNRTVSLAKICLQFSTNDNIWGYWSNRVGKVLGAGGFLLASYTPGMELFLRDGAAYFSSPEEAVQKIHYYLKNVPERIKIQKRGLELGRDKFTSKARIKELEILIDRFIKK